MIQKIAGYNAFFVTFAVPSQIYFRVFFNLFISATEILCNGHAHLIQKVVDGVHPSLNRISAQCTQAQSLDGSKWKFDDQVELFDGAYEASRVEAKRFRRKKKQFYFSFVSNALWNRCVNIGGKIQFQLAELRSIALL